MLDGLLIDVEGTLSTVQIDDTNALTRLYGLQKQLECQHLNKVLLPPEGIECWVDDEGLYNAAFNPVLTLMTGRDRHSTPLLGSGLFLGHSETTGETRSLTAAEKAELTRTWLGASSLAMLAAADHRLTDLCTRPELHHARYGRRDRETPKGVARPGESEEDRVQREAASAEAARAERARVIANNRSWRTAITVRKTWVAGLIARKKLPADVDVFIGISLTHHVQTLTDYRADDAIGAFLGLKETTYRRREAGNLLADTPTKAHQVALAVVLSAREAQAADEHCWRSVREAVASYLLALEAWGYHLSDVERLAAGYPSED